MSLEGSFLTFSSDILLQVHHNFSTLPSGSLAQWEKDNLGEQNNGSHLCGAL